MKRSTVLRQLFNADEPFVGVAISLAIHAKIAERQGFQALCISGANTSTHILGLPDAGFITMSELVQNTRYICDATSLPVLVDCDTGFAVGKYRAAIDAKNELDPDFVIMSRCDARGAVGGSLEECVRRLRAYKQAGVDVLYAEALQSMDEVRAVRAQIEGPFFVTTMAIRPRPTFKDLQEAGVSAALVFLPHVGLTAMWDMLEEVRTRGLDAWNEYVDRTQDHPLGNFRVFDLTGFPTVREWEQKYLSTETLEKYERSIGAYEPRAGA
ncbi:MAG: isocitrate lyase/PEP mutase family protein [Candidatus Rokubacteria bacterium]|nr:isocitrate lyase/PEP mutase family protein [Candidatus Rokubacteria bacterium]